MTPKSTTRRRTLPPNSFVNRLSQYGLICVQLGSLLSSRRHTEDSIWLDVWPLIALFVRLVCRRKEQWVLLLCMIKPASLLWCECKQVPQAGRLKSVVHVRSGRISLLFQLFGFLIVKQFTYRLKFFIFWTFGEEKFK